MINLLAPKGRYPAITYTPKKVIWQAIWHIMPLAIYGLEHPMATRNVVLPDPMEQDINELVETGRYQNRSEVIRAGLRCCCNRKPRIAPSSKPSATQHPVG